MSAQQFTDDERSRLARELAKIKGEIALIELRREVAAAKERLAMMQRQDACDANVS